MFRILTQRLWENRSGRGTTWFHPRIAALDTGRLVMTLQGVEGSDYFLPVHESVSDDRGATWSDPAPIPGLGRRPVQGDIEEGICDVLPLFHAPTRTILALGQTVLYRGGRLYDSVGDWETVPEPRLPRWTVYSIRDEEGNWAVVREPVAPPFDGYSLCVGGCDQPVFVGDDLVYLAMSVGFWGRRDRVAMTFRCRYDGRSLTVLEAGPPIELPAGRGIMEPQLARRDGRFLITLRTEDGRGHYATSDDGLRWSPPAPWTFDTGEVPDMVNNQQHWLEHGGRLYLLYHRQLPYNRHLMRWRSPLLIAEVDTDRMVLRRATEQVVFPMMPEDTNEEFQAALYGNFHPVNLSPTESIVTVGEERSHDGYRGDTLLARLVTED